MDSLPETYMICLANSQTLFCERAGSVGANPIKPTLIA